MGIRDLAARIRGTQEQDQGYLASQDVFLARKLPVHQGGVRDATLQDG